MTHQHTHHLQSHQGHILSHTHCHHGNVSEKTVRYLSFSFIINLALSVVELIAGLIAGSVALVGDALHNASDAFSVFIAVFAYKIGLKKADKRFTYGFKRAEVIGGFVNLILLFISGLYLLVEGITKLILPQNIDGMLIIWVSVGAVLIDGVTAWLSHKESAHNGNMKMLFIHNLADMLGSIGVIISGLLIVLFGWIFTDGIIALCIAGYMIGQAVISFPNFVRILMNATPAGVDIDTIRTTLLQIPHVQDVHHIHVWCVNEHDISLECHVVSPSSTVVKTIQHVLKEQFNIAHVTIQTDTDTDCETCCFSCNGHDKEEKK